MMMKDWAKLAGAGAIVMMGVVGCTEQQQTAGNESATGTATSDATTDNAMMADNTATDNMATDNMATGMAVGDLKKAVAVLNPTKGSNVRGTVTFSREDGGVRVVANFTGLKPGPHGFHVHENGDCSAADATSAGGHYNPTEMPHSGPDDENRHVGDLGNLTAKQDGTATYNQLDPVLTLDGPNGIIGRAVIVHANADDLKSQPSGDAGGRQSCGVIGVAQVENPQP